MLIDTVTLYRFSLPLIEPYKLAMGVVGAFDTVLAVIEDGGGTGFGEATILTGYTPETIDESWKIAIDLAARVQGLEGTRAKPVIEAEHKRAPFTCSALMTAVEMLERNPHPSADEVRAGLEGNICRCTGYQNIVRAVLAAAEAKRS